MSPAPERDEFEVPAEMAAAARRALLGPSNLTNIETAKPTLTTDQICERIIRAVAPLIRAEGYKQGVEDAAKVARQAYDFWDRGNVAAEYKRDAAAFIVSRIIALPNQPDASEGHET